MTITIRFKADSAAFEGVHGPSEARRLLEQAAERLGESDVLVRDTWTLRDINGNIVGSVTVTGK